MEASVDDRAEHSSSTAPTRPIFKVLAGQKALVTGANSGIGRAIAVASGQAGADVMVNWVAGEEAAEAGVDAITKNGGRARPRRPDAAFHEMTLAQWNTVIDVNLTGQFLCAREAIREFLRRGVVPEVSCAAGKIICMSSVHQEIPWAGHANYAASKGGGRSE